MALLYLKVLQESNSSVENREHNEIFIKKWQ